MRGLRKGNQVFPPLLGIPVRLFGNALPFEGKFKPLGLPFGVLGWASHSETLAGPVAVLFCVFRKHSDQDYSGGVSRALNRDRD
jgi:hypothetical protein